MKNKNDIVVFGGGCFWCTEAVFKELKGVISVMPGYAGGPSTSSGQVPTYEEVCTGQTGHAEAVEVEYDPQRVSYETLLNLFWEIHDPSSLDRQGPDIGTQYRSAIFFHLPEQQSLALDSKEKLALSRKFKTPIVTQIVPAATFYPAEEYHQRYLEKQGITHCGLPRQQE